MFRPERWEYRITLTDVDRGVSVDRTVVVGRHPSETSQHLSLRLLAYCLVYEDGITFGPGISVEDAPDLMAHDLTGQLSIWVGCGDVAPDLAKKIVQHNRGARAHIVFDGHDRMQAFIERTRHWPKPPRHWANLTLWVPPAAVLSYLEDLPTLNQRWVVTLTGGHMYLDVDGVMVDGDVEVVLASSTR